MSYRLPIFSALRSKADIDPMIDTEYGQIPQAILKRIEFLSRTCDLLSLSSLHAELSATLLIVDDLINAVAPAETEFNREVFPNWFLEYIKTRDNSALTMLTPEEIARQREIVICEITSVDDKRVVWKFCTNSLIMSGAAVDTAADLTSIFAPKQFWALCHNTKRGLDAKILGGIKLSDTDASSLSHTLASLWRRNNPR